MTLPALARSAARPRVVVFDLDGTLVDTMGAFADVAARLIREAYGIDAAEARARYLATSGLPFFAQLDIIAPGRPTNAALAARFEHEKLVATRDVLPTRRTIAALQRLRARGLGLAVSSNNLQMNVERMVRASGAPIDLALGFDGDVGKGEAHFQRICRTFLCSRDEMVFVGDSLHDARIASAAGVAFVAVLGTASAQEFARTAPSAPRIEDVADLEDIVLDDV